MNRAAQSVAMAIVNATAGYGPLAALAASYLFAALLTGLITNNAVAVLMFPVFLDTARLCHADSRPFLMALTLAASASLMTPIGYQTNMLVYGPGGYRFMDFVRIGAPLTLILWGVAVVLIPIFWRLALP